MSPITNVQAEKVISGAKRRAVELGVAASIAVHDDGGSREHARASGLRAAETFDLEI